MTQREPKRLGVHAGSRVSGARQHDVCLAGGVQRDQHGMGPGTELRSRIAPKGVFSRQTLRQIPTGLSPAQASCRG
ncbi:hypothetical protein IQ782_08695 [Salipiger pacificus]|uniref:Uncharacterized protein n=1 Tax=Salipiger mangrovisoli TaxID=2865933 RepID=A0ABR9X039_9RHOB|nr:hypothetical protein [Salipiger mangrovisoli]